MWGGKHHQSFVRCIPCLETRYHSQPSISSSPDIIIVLALVSSEATARFSRLLTGNHRPSEAYDSLVTTSSLLITSLIVAPPLPIKLPARLLGTRNLMADSCAGRSVLGNAGASAVGDRETFKVRTRDGKVQERCCSASWARRR